MSKLLLGLLALIPCGLLTMGLASYLWPVSPPAQKPAVDFILVDKHQHEMQLFDHGKVVRRYAVALGRGGHGAKTRAGDNKVPEGLYRITGRNPQSAFHLSLRIGYPTVQQQTDAKRAGVDPGGDVMIHGIRRGMGWLGAWHRELDWTRGCIAVTDEEIEEIWRIVPGGTPIEITA